jgi:hypothetical protein
MNRRAVTKSILAIMLAIVPGGHALFGRAQQSVDNAWQLVSGRPQTAAARTDLIGQVAVVRLDRAVFNGLMRQAPGEPALRSNGVVFSLPMPDGRFTRFRIAESPILAPELAAAFPEIKTYAGQGIDDPTATTRFGWTERGFHAIVLSAAATVYIDPYAPGDLDFYVAASRDALQQPGVPFQCLVTGSGDETGLRTAGTFPLTNGTALRTYRLALAATGEYTVAAGGTKSLALSRMTTTMNRVNGIYERDLAVRMTVATGTGADPTALIYTDGTTDPYTNNSGSTMLGQNQTNIDSVVGTANYDVGHVFSTAGGGVAYLRAPCASFKAGGVTGLSNPTGDAFDVDYVAHEMGHQFGGNHTFNSTTSSCGGGNRSSSNAYEVGSGSTIQAYAGICGVEDLQRNSHDYFHIESLNEMTAFITSGGGAACGTASATGNTLPATTTSATFTIPVSTPFVLAAVATDANGDALTYAWEQYDLGTASTSVATASTDDGSRPLFRSYAPTTSGLRYFPSMTYVLNNANVPPTTYACSSGTCLTGETLPTTSRPMHYYATIRDNRSGGGGINTAAITVTSTTAAGPFVVTAPNTALSLSGGAAQVVTWNVASTTASPVSVANVRILLSTDGGTTFGTELAASTANDGSESVTLPNITTTTARIKVEAVGNIFFDVSNTNFSITTSLFTDNPLVAGTTTIKALHITELRTAINTLRVRYGLAATTWATDPTLTAATTTIKAAHLTEMRTALSAAYVASGRAAPTYAAATITAGTTTITAAQITELRTLILAIY